MKYKIVGPCSVAGHKPGSTVELGPEDANIPALIAAGHIERAQPSRRTKKHAEDAK